MVMRNLIQTKNQNKKNPKVALENQDKIKMVLEHYYAEVG